MSTIPVQFESDLPVPVPVPVSIRHRRRAHPSVRPRRFWRWWAFAAAAVLLCSLSHRGHAQSLLNIDFGVGSASRKSGPAGTGQATNDFWNLYRHYDPKFVPGAALVPDGFLAGLKLADGTETKAAVGVTNAPGVWGNSSGDPMYDSYIFSQNGSNITVAVHGLEPGRYHFYLYGHADPDVTGEQNSIFTLRAGTNSLGPLTALGSNGWKASAPWQERQQYVVFRDVLVSTDDPVWIDVAPGPNGAAVLNGLQIISRGTSPPRLAVTPPPPVPSTLTNLFIHEVRYEGTIKEAEARFAVTLDLESMTTNEISRPLFEGDVALIVPELPPGLRITSSARKYQLHCAQPGRFEVKLELISRTTKAEPWNQTEFLGPAAAIASVTATATAGGVELQLLSGTQLESTTKGMPRVQGSLGPDRRLALRWQGRTAEISRKSLVTVETAATAHITPSVVKFVTRLDYQILQAPVTRLRVGLPRTHVLTRVQGEQIRDWSVQTEGAQQLLQVEFISPLEKAYSLTLLSEQPVESASSTTALAPPQPLDVERETGSFALSAEDMTVEVGTITGLRQVNAAAGMLVAYRFHGRPLDATARLTRIEPVLKVRDRVLARLEENRFLINHSLNLSVERTGLYSLELLPQPGFLVADVRGEGVDDWKLTDGRLRIQFAARLLGTRRIEVQLEQPQPQFSNEVTVLPLRTVGATNEVAEIGAASALGIRIKTSTNIAGLREMPIASLSSPTDELLAYKTDDANWRLTLAAERLPARIVADLFNLVTVGDGLVGGSVVLRYGILNQGVQEFRLKLPSHWKNVEFIGPNIRRKELIAAPAGEVVDTNAVYWLLALQDKAWGGYTLVVTYDYQFDPRRASLDLAGAHAVGVERETGSIALTTASSLQLQARPIAAPLRLIDQTELAETDRSLITRPVLLAYQYTGSQFALVADVTRHNEVSGLLDAVADRTQITSVITEDGQMLSQAGFMVKNNDKQSQRFKLPAGASLWACYVNNQPVKAEMDGEWLLVSLPRGDNRDEAFAVDIVYKQSLAALKSGLIPRGLELTAPRTDVPNTYAEWQLYLPTHRKLMGFAGSMSVQRGTTYTLRDGLRRFLEFYADVFREHGAAIVLLGGAVLMIGALIIAAVKRGRSGLITVLVTLMIVGLAAGMLLPALGKAKAKAQRVSGMSNLKQLALAARLFASDNGRLPGTFEEMSNELGGNLKAIVDPTSGERFVYVGNGKRADDPRSILAYSPVDVNGRTVAFADGSVRMLSSEEFARALQLDAQVQLQPAPPGLSVDQLTRMGAQSQLGTVAANQPAPTDDKSQAAGPGQMPGKPLIAATAPNVGGPAIAGQPATSAPQAPPTAAGLRSIRIDIPRTGQMLTFTKVLNISEEPLSVRMSVMGFKHFQVLRSTLQFGFFALGLLMVWLEWHRLNPRSFRLALGLAFAGGAVVSLGIAWRSLHLWLVALVPIAGLVLICLLVRRFWPRMKLGPEANTLPAPSTDPSGTSPIPPAVAGLVVLFTLAGLCVPSVQADEPASQRPASAGALTNAVAINSALYQGTVNDKVAQLDVQISISSISSNQVVELFGPEVAVQQFSSDAREARLVRHGQGVALRLLEAGHATLRLKLAVKLEGDITRRRLDFAIPPALASRVNVEIDEPEADVEFPSAVAFQRSTNGALTRVEAVLGAGDRVRLSWTPRMKRIGEMAASIFAQSSSLVTIGGGAVSIRSVIDYQIAQGELRQAKVRLPAGQRLLRVEGEWIRTWELSDEAGASVLTVDLVKSVSQNYRLALETEKVLEPPPTLVRLEAPQVRDVLRESGMIAVRGGEELSVTLETAQDLQRVDSTEFARNQAHDKTGELFAAWRFLKHGFTLALRAEPVQPQIEVALRNRFNLGFESITLAARADYTIKRAGVFALRLAVPADFKVDSVTAGGPSQKRDAATRIAAWHHKPESNLVEVTLAERTVGRLHLDVTLTRLHREISKTNALSGVIPLGVQKLTGTVSVTSEAGLAIRTTSFQGLTEIPSSALAETAPAKDSSVLAYRAIGTDPGTAGAWQLQVAVDLVESWVRAEVVNLVSTTETLLSGRSLVRYEIQNAPVKEFRLRVPAGLTNVEILGTDIRRRDRVGADEWRVELQNKVRGTYQLTVTWEQARGGASTNATATNATEIVFAGVQALGVERETGMVVFLARPPLQLTERFAPEPLVRIDVREVPSWAGLSTTAAGANAEVPVLAYRYLRSPYVLTVDARRFSEASLLQAMVDSVRLTTVVADDGQMMTEMALQVRNNGLQHLEIELPAGARVWSAFVAGQPERPTIREGKLLLPLERSLGDGAPMPVELTFVDSRKFPRRKGDVSLQSPRFGVPIKNARWELYLPPDFEYSEFTGSMSHDESGSSVVQVYSTRDYYRQEQSKKAARKSDVRGFLSSARSKLAEGKLKVANEEFNNASRFNRDDVDAETLRELDGLKKELSKSQSSNLIQAQRSYTAENAQRLAGAEAATGGRKDVSDEIARQVFYDAESAEQQWGALQRAQELTTVKVQPLRANLPTRGVRHEFTQVLQTEVGRPMTVAFEVVSTREVGWFTWMMWLGAGFLLLWACAGVVVNRKNSSLPADLRGLDASH